MRDMPLPKWAEETIRMARRRRKWESWVYFLAIESSIVCIVVIRGFFWPFGSDIGPADIITVSLFFLALFGVVALGKRILDFLTPYPKSPSKFASFLSAVAVGILTNEPKFSKDELEWFVYETRELLFDLEMKSSRGSQRHQALSGLRSALARVQKAAISNETLASDLSAGLLATSEVIVREESTDADVISAINSFVTRFNQVFPRGPSLTGLVRKEIGSGREPRLGGPRGALRFAKGVLKGIASFSFLKLKNIRSRIHLHNRITKYFAYRLRDLFTWFGFLILTMCYASGAEVFGFYGSAFSLGQVPTNPFPYFEPLMVATLVVFLSVTGISVYAYSDDKHVRALQLLELPRRFPYRSFLVLVLAGIMGVGLQTLPASVHLVAVVTMSILGLIGAFGVAYWGSGLVLFCWFPLSASLRKLRPIESFSEGSDVFWTLSAFIERPWREVYQFKSLLKSGYNLLVQDARSDLPHTWLGRLEDDFALFEICMTYGTDDERTSLSQFFLRLSEHLKTPGRSLQSSTDAQNRRFPVLDVLNEMNDYRKSLKNWEEFRASNLIRGRWRDRFVLTRSISDRGGALVFLAILTVILASWPYFYPLLKKIIPLP